jgi:site-specific DNA-methyltransferase (adenine-specific)
VANISGKLAAADRHQFQFWALSLVAARPLAKDEKKGADGGIDGVIFLSEGKGAARPIVIQVKSGHVTAAQIRDLIGVMDRERRRLACSSRSIRRRSRWKWRQQGRASANSL